MTMDDMVIAGSMMATATPGGNIRVSTAHDVDMRCALIRGGEVIVERADLDDLIRALTKLRNLT